MASRIFVHVAEDEIENIPLHEDVFSSDSEDESGDEGLLLTLQHFYLMHFEDNLMERMARRTEKAQRSEARHARVAEYEEYTFCGPSTAITVFG